MQRQNDDKKPSRIVSEKEQNFEIEFIKETTIKLQDIIKDVQTINFWGTNFESKDEENKYREVLEDFEESFCQLRNLQEDHVWSTSSFWCMW